MTATPVAERSTDVTTAFRCRSKRRAAWSVNRCETASSSAMSSLGPRCTMLTAEPKAAKTCPISAAMNPPPMTAIDRGTSAMRMIVSDVWKSTPSSPGIAGMAGRDPEATTICSPVMARSPTWI